MNQRVRTFRHRTAQSLWTILVLAHAGCDVRDVKPKGHGASGSKALQPLAVAQVDIERFHKLTPKQQQCADAMQRKAETVLELNAKSSNKKAKEDLAKITEKWSEVVFVDLKEGKRVYHRAVLQTNAGDLHISFFENAAPDHVRNFLVRAKNGFLDGVKLSHKNNKLEFGRPAGEEAYSLKPRNLSVPIPHNVVYAYSTGSRMSGEHYGITLAPDNSLSGKVTIIGRVGNANPRPVYQAIVKQLEKDPNSVQINRVSFETDWLHLFRDDGVMLPDLDPTGEPITKDVQMFTNATIGAGAAPVSAPSEGNPNQPKKK